MTEYSYYDHTPGPWMIGKDGSIRSASVRTAEHVVIKPGTVKGSCIGVAVKNAKLIAAAPELLAVCLDFIGEYNDWFCEDYKDSYLDDLAKRATEVVRKAIERTNADHVMELDGSLENPANQKADLTKSRNAIHATDSRTMTKLQEALSLDTKQCVMR